ncbi:hypothetical protein MASR2M18_09700 [Ignavibacteria bacterium]
MNYAVRHNLSVEKKQSQEKKYAVRHAISLGTQYFCCHKINRSKSLFFGIKTDYSVE